MHFAAQLLETDNYREPEREQPRGNSLQFFMLFSNYLYEVSQFLSFLQAYTHLTFIRKELNIHMPTTSAM
jgi:hypothetical protein